MVGELRGGDALGRYRSDCDGSSALFLLRGEMRSLAILANECLRFLIEVNFIALRVVCLSVLVDSSTSYLARHIPHERDKLRQCFYQFLPWIHEYTSFYGEYSLRVLG